MGNLLRSAFVANLNSKIFPSFVLYLDFLSSLFSSINISSSKEVGILTNFASLISYSTRLGILGILEPKKNVGWSKLPQNSSFGSKFQVDGKGSVIQNFHPQKFYMYSGGNWRSM